MVKVINVKHKKKKQNEKTKSNQNVSDYTDDFYSNMAICASV